MHLWHAEYQHNRKAMLNASLAMNRIRRLSALYVEEYFSIKYQAAFQFRKTVLIASLHNCYR